MTPPSDTEQLRIQLEQLLNGIDSQMASRLREKSGAPVESNIQRPLASGGLSSIPLPACHLPTRGQQLFDQPRPKSAQPSKPLKEPDALTQRRPSLPIQSYYPNTRLIATLDGRTASIDETSAQKRQPSQSSQTCLNEQCCSSSSVNLTTSSMKNPDTSSPVSILDASYGQNRTSNKVKLEPIITGVGTLPLSQGSIATSGPPALYSASTKSSASLRDHAVHAQNLTEKDDTLDEGLDTILSLTDVTPQAMRHQHKHWHTPIVPPNLAEFEIITELEKKLAEELKSDPNLTLIASQDSLTARLSVNTQKPAKTPLSEMIKNATMRIEMLKEKERAARERAAIESIRHRLEKDKLEPEDKTKNQDQVNEDLVESLSCCGLGRRITGKSKKVHPQRSVYEEQRSKMSRQLREKRKK